MLSYSLLFPFQLFVLFVLGILKYGPYYKSELELKSNSSEILSVKYKFICDSTPTWTDKTQTWAL